LYPPAPPRSGRPGEAVAPLDTPTGSLPAPGRRPSGLDTAAATQFHGADREVPMRADRVISTIDFHTAGIGMRLVTSGLGRIPGATIGEKRRWFQEHLDHVRTGLCLEPRGHRSLLIAIMTEPVTPAAQFGLFFIHPGGYYVSCGEGTIGAATVAVETGMVAPSGAETPVTIDTEAGVVETVARSAGRRRGVAQRARVGTGAGRRRAVRLRHVRAHGALPPPRAHAGRLDVHEPRAARARLHGPDRRRDRRRGAPRDPAGDHGHRVPH